VRPGDDASWSLGLLRQAAFQDVVGALFLTAFWLNLRQIFTVYTGSADGFVVIVPGETSSPR
jgi:hypothetical protein